MSFGFRTIGNSGYYQIDETTIDLFFRAKYTLTPSGSNFTASLTVSGDTPVPVICSQNNWVGIYSTTNSNGTWTFNFVCRSADAFTIYLYDRLPAGTSAANWSLNIWDASGRLKYRGDQHPLRVAGFVACTLGSVSDPTVGTNVSSNLWGAIADYTIFHRVAGPGAGSLQVVNCIKTYPTSISIFSAGLPTTTVVPLSQSGDVYTNHHIVLIDLSDIG